MEINTINRLSQKKFIKKYGIEPEDAELIGSLQLIGDSLAVAHHSFDITTDRALLDSISYEIMSLNKKYEYYLRRCKERGLMGRIDFGASAYH